ncbi:MAG: sulfatase family protein [Pirellulales bacterium]
MSIIKLFYYQLLLITASCWFVSNLASSSVFAAEKKQPNILFFFTDDQRFDTLGCAGHPIIKTPNIDQLAAEGVRFDNMFVSHSICWVSRTTILTGLTARSFGEYDKPDQAKPEAVTAMYPDLLRQAGYRTAHFGKWHAKMPKGFNPKDHYDVFEPIFRNPYLKKQADGSLRHETELIGDKAVAFLKEQKKDQPFSINLWFNASHAEDRDHRPGVGHFPWPKATDGMYEDIDVPAPRLNDPAIYASQPQYLKDSINRERYFWRWDTPEKYQTNIRAYFRMISGIDNVVGRVLKTVKEQGFADNTIVIYTADNGYYMGDRGFAGKWSHYEQSLRVPLIVYDPRLPKASRGKVVSQLAMNLDLPVSFLSWTGVDVPNSYQGLNLVPLVQGAIPKTWRKDMFVEHVTLRPTISWEGVRNTRYKYARYFDQTKDAEFLHDLQTDPDELKNFVNDPNYADVLKRLRTRTDELVNHYGAPLAPYKPQPAKKKKK